MVKPLMMFRLRRQTPQRTHLKNQAAQSQPQIWIIRHARMLGYLKYPSLFNPFTVDQVCSAFNSIRLRTSS